MRIGPRLRSPQKARCLWSIGRLRKLHSCPKPVALYSELLNALTLPGQAVYEPFSGSGNTIIAAEMTGRICHAIEIEPRYIDVAVRRWQAFTGLSATLEATGQSFADIEVERARQAA